ncbi:glycoside hydrolase family 88 protein [Flavobacterium sp. 83]|uniref:glycoside hydrolase family 88 protein n=1 Tax=Flavobacterium sp. 83 TaxID=1131812 RepID=UPI00054CF260|nr:glycoside hydrolase family 88 protein [Flavobacterium sp. 83]
MNFTISKQKLLIILIVSIALNLLVFIIDTFPFIYPKLENFQDNNTILGVSNPEEQIASKSLEIAKSNILVMGAEHKGFTETIFNLRRGDYHSGDWKTYNYPKAFLYYGLSEYFIEKGNRKSLNEFKIIFDKLIDNQGNPIFDFDKVDQVPFGSAALNLYKFYKEDKYLNFSNLVYKKLLSMSDKNGIIMYRKELDFQLDDVLGMVVPFLMEYDKIKHDGKSVSIAKKQLDFYIKYGVDKETFLPTHGIVLKSKIKIGPTNWGRGIGWYLLALSKYSTITGEYKKELTGLLSSLDSLKTKEGFWTQFPGSSNNFDASPTAMFMYSISLTNKNIYKKADVLKKLGIYISKEGLIKFTSGDTHGINDYSKSFGYSEFSQGMLLLLLSNIQ